MVNQLKYSLAALLVIPLLPLMYFQGKKIRKNVPSLPEAKGTEGVEGKSNHQINLMAIGESTIAGVGVDQHKNGFTGTLAKELAQRSGKQVNWKVVAKSGYTAANVAKELLPKIQNTQPDIIVIGLGGNDAFHLNSPVRWRKSMNSVLTQLTRSFPDAKIVCTNMPPIKEFPAFTPVIKSVVGNLVNLLGKELTQIVQSFDKVYYASEELTFDDSSELF